MVLASPSRIRQTLSARRKRDSSPPEAIRSSGPGGAPGLVADHEADVVLPLGAGLGRRDLHAKTERSIFRGGSSMAIEPASRPAAAARCARQRLRRRVGRRRPPPSPPPEPPLVRLEASSAASRPSISWPASSAGRPTRPRACAPSPGSRRAAPRSPPAPGGRRSARRGRPARPTCRLAQGLLRPLRGRERLVEAPSAWSSAAVEPAHAPPRSALRPPGTTPRVQGLGDPLADALSPPA